MKGTEAQTKTQPKKASQKTLIINYEPTAEGVSNIPYAFSKLVKLQTFNENHKEALLAFLKFSDLSEDEKAAKLKDIIIKISSNYKQADYWKKCLMEVAKSHEDILKKSLEINTTVKGVEISEIVNELSTLDPKNSHYTSKIKAFIECLESKKESFGEYIAALEPLAAQMKKKRASEARPDPKRQRTGQVDNLNTPNTSAPLLPPAVINVDADSAVERPEVSVEKSNLKKRAAGPKAAPQKRKGVKYKQDPISENDMPDIVLEKLKNFHTNYWEFNEVCKTRAIAWLKSIPVEEAARQQAAEDLAEIIIKISKNQNSSAYWEACIRCIAIDANLRPILRDALSIFTGKIESQGFEVTSDKIKAKLNALITGLAYAQGFEEERKFIETKLGDKVHYRFDEISMSDTAYVVKQKLMLFHRDCEFNEVCKTRAIAWLKSIQAEEAARQQAAEDLAEMIIKISKNRKNAAYWEACIRDIATDLNLMLILRDALKSQKWNAALQSFQPDCHINGKLNALTKGLWCNNRFNKLSESIKGQLAENKNAKSTSHRPMRRNAQNPRIPVALQEHIHDDGEFPLMIELPEMTLEDIQLHIDTMEKALQRIDHLETLENPNLEIDALPYAEIINAYLNLDAWNEGYQLQETSIQSPHTGSDPEPLPNQETGLPNELALQIPNSYIPSAIPAPVVNTYATAAMPQVTTTPVVTNDGLLQDDTHVGRLEKNERFEHELFL